MRTPRLSPLEPLIVFLPLSTPWLRGSLRILDGCWGGRVRRARGAGQADPWLTRESGQEARAGVGEGDWQLLCPTLSWNYKPQKVSRQGY